MVFDDFETRLMVETNKQIFQSKFDDEFEFDEQKEIASYTISQMDIEKWQFVKKLIFT